MFNLVIPKGVYHRANGNLPPFELKNMLAEETPSAEGGVSLLSFPGLAQSATRGTGGIVGVFRQDDLFGGDTFTVSSNNHLYRGATDLGAIDGSGPVWFAASNLELCVGRGTSAWSYNGTNLASIAFPDSANVTWGTFIAGMFVFARASSRKFYWSAIDDGRTIDPLDFASAESTASYLLQSLAIGDVLYHGCGDKIEAWYPTGDGTLPFLKISQRTAKKGIAASGCMAELDNALHFVGADHCIYRLADVPTRISNHGIEEQVANSASAALFAYTWQGHAILMLRLAAASYGFDVLTGQWHERGTWGQTNWLVCCATQQADGKPLFGSALTNQLLVHDSGWEEASSTFAREFTAAIPLDASQVIDSIELDANTGEVADLTLDPQIMMRCSRDRGETWTAWRSVSLGKTGEYRKLPKWRRLGMFDEPGALFHFRLTDAAPFRVSGSTGETSSAGRGR